ncbi:MAG: putative sulfate exporter family transporter [Pseudomonadota bacterium]
MSAVATPGVIGMPALRSHWPGILLSIVVAAAATFIADTRGGPTLLYALLLGMALHTATVAGSAKPGIDFSARRILRLGVALLGTRITLEQIGSLGWYNGSLIVGGVAATIGFGVIMSRVFGLPSRLGLLTGGATAICGASAAIAIASVLPRDEQGERELIFTVAGVTVLSTVAMVFYPLIATALGLTPAQSGIFIGGTIHDVAQVVGAGYSMSHEVGDVAVLTKMLRVAMLLPVVLGLSVALHQRSQDSQRKRSDPLLPPFLVGFIVLLIIGSLGGISAQVGTALNGLSRACLVVAIAAVGLKTSLLEVRKVGLRAALLLGTEAVFLVGFVLLTQYFH